MGRVDRGSRGTRPAVAGVSRGFSRRSLLTATAATGSAVAAGRWRTAAARLQTARVPGKIAFVRDGDIWVWEGNDARAILPGGNISDPRWSPNGRMLLYVRMQNSYSDLYIYDLDTNVETQITFNQPIDEVGSFDYAANSSWVLDPDWSRTGLIGFMSDAFGSGGFLALWLLASPADQPYLALQTVLEDDISGLALAPFNSLATYTVRVRMGNGPLSTYVAIRDLDTGATSPVAQSSGDIFDSAISPDTAWVAVTIRDEDGVTDIWLVDRATGDRRRGTRDANAMAPRWSDDGNWIAYMRMQDYGFEIWVGQFSRGRIRNPFKLYDESGIDSQSGLSWWMPTGAGPATAED